jgi:hypothetical protein
MGRGRNRDDSGTAIAVEKDAFVKLCKAHEKFKPFAEHWRYNSNSESVDISLRHFDLAQMKTLLGIYESLKPEPENIARTETRRETVLHLSSFIKVLENPTGAKVAKLRPLERAIIEWVKKGIKRAWVFVKEEGRMQPYLVTNVRYFPLVVSEGSRTPAHVTMRAVSWSRGSNDGHSVTFHIEDLKGGKTVGDLMLAAGVYKETDELLAAYDKQEATFLTWRAQMGEQFVGTGEFDAQGEERWSRERVSVHGARFVVNDPCKEIEAQRESGIFTEDDDDEPTESEEAIKFNRVPLQHYIYVFNLSTYDNGWIHMTALKPYEYRPELRDKLILPPEHGDLIDALTADMNVLMEDVISGKSGGTTILCQGKAGTGKTLTAEVYAEAIKRPLYRVHSGQLGINAESVEEALKEALDNSKRWRAVLLIDEADVFVSARGGDLGKNAVIGVFLRVLEYYDGLLFLTTNRVDDIDEAILSRCIAVIKYDIPGVEEREKIWLTLGGVYGMELVKSKGMAKQLAEAFPKASGRDIKGLIKLVTKYARQRNKKVELADFKRMAAFRGL